MLDRSLLIEGRGMQDRQPGRSDSRNVKPRGRGRTFPRLQTLEQADQVEDALAQQGPADMQARR